MSIRAILFDFGGTLDQPVHWLDRFLALYRACDIEIDRDQLEPAFTAATKAAYCATATMRHVGLDETTLLPGRSPIRASGMLGA